VSLSEERKVGLGIALNEATWLDMSVETERRRVGLVLRVLSLPPSEASPQPSESIVSVVLSGVTRIVASLRSGFWNDVDAAVVPLDVLDLPDVVRSFGGCPIYGWEFIDPPADEWSHWRNRLSVDVNLSDDAPRHVIDLFQEGGLAAPRHLDLRVWFSELAVYDIDTSAIPLDEFIAAGRRWWDGLFARDQRTAGSGIFPLEPETD
jgi:hypothetical protein